MLPSDNAKVHNAIAALANALAHHLELSPDFIGGFTDELEAELARACNDAASTVSPDMCGNDACDDDNEDPDDHNFGEAAW